MKKFFLCFALFVGLVFISDNAIANDLNSVLTDLGNTGRDASGFIITILAIVVIGVFGGVAIKMYVAKQLDFMAMISLVSISVVVLGAIFMFGDQILPTIRDKSASITEVKVGF